jgi:hypothetical protein
MLKPAEWPAPIELVNEGGSSDVVLLCESTARTTCRPSIAASG